MNKDRIIALFYLACLVIWRAVIEVIRIFLLLLFIIPMLISSKVYDGMQGFFYNSLEDNIKNDDNSKKNSSL